MLQSLLSSTYNIFFISALQFCCHVSCWFYFSTNQTIFGATHGFNNILIPWLCDFHYGFGWTIWLVRQQHSGCIRIKWWNGSIHLRDLSFATWFFVSYILYLPLEEKYYSFVQRDKLKTKNGNLIIFLLTSHGCIIIL